MWLKNYPKCTIINIGFDCPPEDNCILSLSCLMTIENMEEIMKTSNKSKVWKIFVSSTYEDMIPFREAVLDAITGLE